MNSIFQYTLDYCTVIVNITVVPKFMTNDYFILFFDGLYLVGRSVLAHSIVIDLYTHVF